MFEYSNKVKFFIMGVICIILFIGVVIYFYIENKEDDEYFDFEELEEEEIKNEVEDVIIEEEKIVVHISGEVINPGVISLNEGARLIDAINMVGGVTEKADLDKVNLAYVLSDAQKIYIPSKDEEESENSDIIISENYSLNNNKNLIVNINTANEEELQSLPGIGSLIAKRIVDYRKENGKFNSIENIKNVSGIGESKFNKIKNNISIK